MGLFVTLDELGKHDIARLVEQLMWTIIHCSPVDSFSGYQSA
jgi:hypothetical protein